MSGADPCFICGHVEEGHDDYHERYGDRHSFVPLAGAQRRGVAKRAQAGALRNAVREMKDSLLDPFQGLSNYVEYNTPDEVIQRVRDAIKALEELLATGDG